MLLQWRARLGRLEAHLQSLIEKHVAETGSAWDAEILRDMRSFIGHWGHGVDSARSFGGRGSSSN